MAYNRPLEYGDSWTFIAIERDTKLILAHKVGQRDNETCATFLRKVATATSGRFQVTTDGLRAYSLNVPFILGSRVDFAQLIKVFATPHSNQAEARYSPAAIVGTEKHAILGSPEETKVCTSHIERFNLTYRQCLKRFARLTLGHSKSRKHHTAMQAIFMAWYNFGRRHETLKGKTPAMVSGLSDKPWSVKELIENAAAA